MHQAAQKIVEKLELIIHSNTWVTQLFNPFTKHIVKTVLLI